MVDRNELIGKIRAAQARFGNMLSKLEVSEVSSVSRAANPRARVLLRKAADGADDELPDHLTETAAGRELIELVAEHRKTPQGRKLSAKQALAHLSLHDGDGRKLFSSHSKEREIIAGLGKRGAVAATEEEHDMTTIRDVFSKAATPEQIQKASRMVLESIAKREMERNPGLSWDKALAQATLTPEYSAAHRAEKEFKFGPGF